MLKRASICVFKSCSRVDVDIDRNKWSDSQFFSLMMAIWRCTFLTATLANKIAVLYLLILIIIIITLYIIIISTNYYLLLFIIIIIFFIY